MKRFLSLMNAAPVIAPALGGGVGQPATPTAPVTATPPPATPAAATPPTLDATKLLEAAKFTLSPAEKAERLGHQVKGLTSEIAKYKTMEASLAEQGLKATFDRTGKFAGYERTEKFSKEINHAPLAIDKLTEREKELLEKDPAAALEAIGRRVTAHYEKQFVRPEPTVEGEAVVNVSPEVREAAIETLANRVNAFGEKAFPDAKELAPVVHAILDDPDFPPALLKAYSSNPDYMTRLILNDLRQTRADLMSTAQKQQAVADGKKTAGQLAAELAPPGTGRVQLAPGQILSPQDAAKETVRLAKL